MSRKTRDGQGHSWQLLGGRLHWLYCRRCGLIKLKNPASERAARKRCNAQEVESDG